MGRSRLPAGWSAPPPKPLSMSTAVARGYLKRLSDSNLATSASKKPNQVETAGFQSPINTQCSSSAPKATSSADNQRSSDANCSIPAPREPIEVAKDVKHSKKTVFQRPCVTHFSHSHPLRPMEAKAEDELICSGCGLDLTGQAYKCSKSSCNFLLHRSCLSLDRVLQHDSHKQHSLVLLSSPPKDNKEYSGIFVCSACNGDGTSFVYHCAECNFDLHVGCALLPKTVEHVDHQIQNHCLQLLYSAPSNIEEVVCEVCVEDVPEEQWMYYCTKCQYCTHLHCTEEVEKEEEEEDDDDDDDDSDDEVLEV